MPNILLVEDDSALSELIASYLQRNDFHVRVIARGDHVLEEFRRQKPDLVVLDLMLPGLDGLQVCRLLRQESQSLPILMLTALGTTDDKVTGLDAGADDYLVKPFEFKELLARVRALTKRGSTVSHTAQVLRFADLEVSLDAKTVYRSGNKINLTAREFNLLVYLIRNQGRVISKVEIAEQVWDIGFDTGTNVIEVYVNYLRKKIDKDYPVKLIHTQFGMGYVLKVE